MSTLREEARKAGQVVILGGGFIGAEFADELVRQSDTEVHVVEMMPKLLQAAFDDEFCDDATDQLVDAGVNVHTGVRAMSLDGENRVTQVTLDNGKILPADLVVVGVGGKPTRNWQKMPVFELRTEGPSGWIPICGPMWKTSLPWEIVHSSGTFYPAGGPRLAGLHRNIGSADCRNQYLRYSCAAPDSGHCIGLFHEIRKCCLCQRRHDAEGL